MVAPIALEHLTRLGRERGHLRIDDLRRALPIDSMPLEHLASVIARLEDNGVTIEIDPALMATRNPSAPPQEYQAATPPPARDTRASALAAAIKAARTSSEAPSVGAHAPRSTIAILLLAGVLVCLMALGLGWLT